MHRNKKTKILYICADEITSYDFWLSEYNTSFYFFQILFQFFKNAGEWGDTIKFPYEFCEGIQILKEKNLV